MTKIKLTTTFDLDDQNQVDIYRAVSELLTGVPASVKKESISEKPKKGKASKEEPKEEVQEEEEQKIKIESVRALLAKKVESHRTEIKNKLTELGANNVSSLDEKHYPDFVDFLNGLK